jgi:hypothetical protein
MSARIISDEIIPAGEYTSFRLDYGQTLRIIDIEGKQVADLVALSSDNKAEKLSCVYSNILNGTWKLTKGDRIYTNRANPIFLITEDKAGLHYSGGGFCSEEINYLRFKVRGTRNCADNLTAAFRPFGIGREDFDFDNCFNIFMNLTFQSDGSMRLGEPLSGPGDYIELTAEMNSIVAISNCPQDKNPCNAFRPTPLHIQVMKIGR